MACSANFPAFSARWKLNLELRRLEAGFAGKIWLVDADERKLLSSGTFMDVEAAEALAHEWAAAVGVRRGDITIFFPDQPKVDSDAGAC